MVDICMNITLKTMNMKNLIPLLLFSSATFYSTFANLPINAMSCNESPVKADVACEKNKVGCDEVTSDIEN